MVVVPTVEIGGSIVVVAADGVVVAAVGAGVGPGVVVITAGVGVESGVVVTTAGVVVIITGVVVSSVVGGIVVVTIKQTRNKSSKYGECNDKNKKGVSENLA